MAEKSRPLTNEELATAYDGPAVAANRALIAMTAGGVRIAFVEEGKNVAPKFRAAIILPVQDAIALKNVLGTLLADIEKQLEEKIATAAAEIKEDG